MITDLNDAVKYKKVESMLAISLLKKKKGKKKEKEKESNVMSNVIFFPRIRTLQFNKRETLDFDELVFLHTYLYFYLNSPACKSFCHFWQYDHFLKNNIQLTTV